MGKGTEMRPFDGSTELAEVFAQGIDGRCEMRKRFYIILFLVVSLLIIHCSFCFAIRPLYTEDAQVVPLGNLYVESGLLLLTNRDNSGIKELVTTLRYGFALDFEGSLDMPYLSRFSSENNYDGLSDGNVKIKYNFYNGYTDFASFMVGFLPGNLGTGTTSSHSDINTMLMYANSFDQFSYNLNFGYTFDGDNSGAPLNNYIIYNASAVRPLTEAMNIMGEIQYSRNTYTLDIVGEAAIGINYRFNENLTFDTALGCGLNENSSSSNFVVGLTYLIL